MHGCEAIITEFQMAGLTDQCEQSLDGPTDFSQATAMGHARAARKSRIRRLRSCRRLAGVP